MTQVYPYGVVEVSGEATGTFKVNGQYLKPYFVDDVIPKRVTHPLQNPS